MNIIIAGAGIGGMTAALCLAQAGHRVDLIERTPELSDIGSGLQCGANAIHVLASLGLMEAVQRTAVEPQRVEFRDGLNGDLLHVLPLGQEYQRRYGAPYLNIHRADLQKVLWDAVQQQSKIECHFGHSVERFSEGLGYIDVVLDNEQTISGDGLIGADGIKSKVRAQILGANPPSYTGNIAWRGVVPRELLPNDFMHTIVSNFVGPDKHMVIYYLREQQLVNFVGVVENRSCQDVSWVTRAPWQEFAEDFADWHPMVQAIVDAVDKDACYRWALCDHKPFDHWSTERATLLGDAAHATLPFMASGAAMAIEDARILQRSLEHSSNVAKAFQCYQRNRLSRTARIQSTSAKLGRIYHLRHRLAQKTAFKMISMFGAKQQSFLPKYDANTVVLR